MRRQQAGGAGQGGPGQRPFWEVAPPPTSSPAGWEASFPRPLHSLGCSQRPAQRSTSTRGFKFELKARKQTTAEETGHVFSLTKSRGSFSEADIQDTAYEKQAADGTDSWLSSTETEQEE